MIHVELWKDFGGGLYNPTGRQIVYPGSPVILAHELGHAVELDWVWYRSGTAGGIMGEVEAWAWAAQRYPDREELLAEARRCLGSYISALPPAQVKMLIMILEQKGGDTRGKDRERGSAYPETS